VSDARRYAPATARNREPILAVLARIVPEGARVLEVASGTGEHAVFLAARLPVAAWQPTDPDPDARASIAAWRAHAGVPAVRAPLPLDVRARPWAVAAADVLVCINMVHIAPFEACEALFAGAADVLSPLGVVYLYGPYKRDGRHTAESNAAFDQSLRARDPTWGVRDIADVAAAASRAGFALAEVAPMPANNLSLVFVRGPA
jgi:hypothetical protein